MTAQASSSGSKRTRESAAKKPKTLYVIDGLAQLFRAYHAIRSNLSSPVTKEPTNATFGWVGMLLKVLREYQPDYLAVVVDVSGDRETFRSKIYPEYKANREEPPMDFKPQVTRSLDVARRMGIPVLGIEGHEADDVIASIVRRLIRETDDLRIRIVSKDKDLEQLLSERVEMIDVHRDEVIDLKALEEKKGITPRQARDVLALMGDTIDNIPGVPGIGPKTAAQLISKYGSIDALYEHLDEIKGKRRENLESSREAVELSRRLVTLVDDLEPEFKLDDATVDVRKLPVSELLDLFNTLGFNRYRDELKEIAGVNDESSRSDNAASSGDARAEAGGDEAFDGDNLFAQAARDDAVAAGGGAPKFVDESKRGKHHAVTTREDLKKLAKQLREAGRFAVDTETTSVIAMKARLCGISVSTEEGEGAYIPIRSPAPEQHLNEDEVIEILRPLFEDETIEKVGQNLKYDWVVLRRHGVRLNGVRGDAMIASYLVDSSRASHRLDAMAEAFLDYRCIPISQLIGEKGRGRKQIRFDEVPLDLAAQYAAEDADVSLRLVNHLEPQLKVMGLRSLYDEVEMPLVEVLASMEYEGIRVDPETLDAQREVLNRRIEDLRNEIRDAAPRDFSPDSPKQLAAVLFNAPDDPEAPGLGLKVIKRGKTGPSTDIEVLEKLADDPEIETPVPNLIVEYRQLTKLVNTYLVAIKDDINEETGRVHASFNQTVAATGRLSSSDPNLQNIPIRSEVGRQIRKAFVACPGCKLITADYSQIELRLLAHLSGDKALVEAFNSGEDIHRTVAATVYGVEVDDVTREQRASAKMVNFGIVYGITPYGLARRLGSQVSNEEAAKIIEDYKARFTGIQKFLEKCVHDAKEHGFVETILQRRRAVPQVHSRNPRERSLGERVAINSVVQGSAADLIKVAMVNLYRRLPEQFPETRMLFQILGELVFESPDEAVREATEFVVGEMESAMDLKVPLVVEAESAVNWLEGK